MKKRGNRNRRRVVSDYVELVGSIVVPKRFGRAHVRKWHALDVDEGDLLRSYAPFVIAWDLLLVDIDDEGNLMLNDDGSPLTDAEGNPTATRIDESVIEWDDEDIPYFLETFIATAISPLVIAAFSPKKTPRR